MSDEKQQEQKIKFSIIVPVYNSISFLNQCVESLRSQSYENIEILLIDDGSKDGSAGLCDSFAEKDKRIQVLHKTNKGQGAARNDGIHMASGEYILFVDADDYIDLRTCETLRKQIDEVKADIYAFGYVKEREDGSTVYHSRIIEAVYLGDDILKKFALHFFGDSYEEGEDDLRGVAACMSCYSRQLLADYNIQFPSERKVLSEDTIFNLDAIQHAAVVVTMQDELYHYVMHSGSHSHRYFARRLTSTADFINLLEEYACRCGIEKQVQNRLGNMAWLSVMECLKQASMQERPIHLIKEVLHDPFTAETFMRLDTAKLPAKQRVFSFAARHHLILAILILSGMRMRQNR